MTPRYSIVRFSPNPEEIERVGVAIYLWGTGQMVFDKEFPRLRCLAPGFNTSLLLQSLHHIQRKLSAERSATAPEHLAISPQFTIEQPRSISAETPAVVNTLLRRYLGHGPKALRDESGVRSTIQVESLLQDFLLARFGVPDSAVMKRAAPSQFLSRGIASRLTGDKIVIPRVLSSRNHLVTIDALNLADANHKRVAAKASAISYAFFRLGELRQEIESTEQRSLTRVVVLFDGHDRHFDAPIDFVQRDAEIVDPENLPSDDLRAVIAETVKELPPLFD